MGYTAVSLPRNLALTLVAGYNVKLRIRIIDRWMELEAKVAQPAISLQVDGIESMDIMKRNPASGAGSVA